MKNRSFTLIELMVTVSILAIGIVMIARSFLSASNALSISQDRVLAVNLLGNKMSDIEQIVLSGPDKIEGAEENVVMNNKDFSYRAFSDEVKIGDDTTQTEADKNTLNRVTLNAGWKEGNVSYDEIVATYVDLEKKDQAPQ